RAPPMTAALLRTTMAMNDARLVFPSSFPAEGGVLARSGRFSGSGFTLPRLLPTPMGQWSCAGVVPPHSCGAAEDSHLLPSPEGVHRGPRGTPARCQAAGGSRLIPDARRSINRPRMGRYLEDFTAGQLIKHWPGRTIREFDNTWFTLLTLNSNPLHFDEHFAKQSQHGRCLVNGTLVFS